MFKRIALSMAAVCGMAVLSDVSAEAQGYYSSTPPKYPTPMPQVRIDPPQPEPPRFPMPMPVVSMPVRPEVRPLIPTDVTNVSERLDARGGHEGGALAGIAPMDADEFPTAAEFRGDPVGILVRHKEGARFSRPTPATVALESGEILVSVHKPANFGLIDTRLASVSVTDAEVMVLQNNDVVRIVNIDGRGKRITVRLAPGSGGSEGGSGGTQSASVYAVAPGYEIVIGAHKLSRADLKPTDGFARRHSTIVANGSVGVSEISVESVLKNCAIVAEMVQTESGSRERRILADMSKMAAVLNYVNGEHGYSVEAPAVAGEKLAHKN